MKCVSELYESQEGRKDNAREGRADLYSVCWLPFIVWTAGGD